MEQPTYCSELSKQRDEPLIGSATPTSTYLLLEYSQAWESKAIPESKLPPPVKEWLSEQTQKIPESKVLLIRTESKSQEGGINFFVNNAREMEPSLYAFRLSRYEDLLDLDLDGILDNHAHQNHRSKDLLFLVCTHGRRDVCCARSGLPVYRTLRDAIADDNTSQLWQVSHIGGHRFAANLICLPHGLLYGRVTPDNATTITREYQNGRIALSNLRGRTPYIKVVQAAEYHLRMQTGEEHLDAYTVKDAYEIVTNHWQIHFVNTQEYIIYQVNLHVEDTNEQVYQGCKLDKLAPLIQYPLDDFKAMEA